jgi:hypothetical protein
MKQENINVVLEYSSAPSRRSRVKWWTMIVGAWLLTIFGLLWITFVSLWILLGLPDGHREAFRSLVLDPYFYLNFAPGLFMLLCAWLIFSQGKRLKKIEVVGCASAHH